ncbi:MAG: PAS domain S-box protein [Bacteroidales bacterium]|nr:PAS domain S-box protein [Bacteroidales bacterium]
MTKETLNGLLLELIISNEFSGDELLTVTRSLENYLKYIKCTKGAVLRTKSGSIEILASLPSHTEIDPSWYILAGIIEEKLSKTATVTRELILDEIIYYSFKLDGYGYLILGNEVPLPEELVNSLGPVASNLGRALLMISELEYLKRSSQQMEKLAFVAAKTHDIIIIADSEGLITYVNKAYEDSTGFTFSEVEGKKPGDFVHGQETDPVTLTRIRNALHERRSIHEEVLNYTKSGKKFWQAMTIEPVFDSDGKCIAWVSISRDITERKNAEKEIRRKEEMLRSVAISADEFLSNSDFLDAIAKNLPIIGKAVDVDRVYLFQNSYDENNMIITSQRMEWNSGVADPQIDNPRMQNIPIEIFDSFLEDLYQKKPFNTIVSELPAGMAYKAILEAQDIQSILIIPIFIKGDFWGLVGYDECKYERIWAEDEISILKSFCITISSAIERSEIMEELFNLSLFPQENPDPQFRIDLEGKIILRNRSAENLTYLLYNGSIYSFDDFASLVARDITSSEPVREYEVETDGKIFIITSLLSQNNIHINNYANNITELKRTQRDLERLSVVASINRSGVYFIDLDYKIIYANEALLRITGYKLDEVLGKTPMKLFHGPLTDLGIYNNLVSASKNVQPAEVDIILYRKDRSWFWANVKKQPAENKETGMLEFFSIVEDISEKKLAEATLKKSQTMLSSLVCNLKEGILMEDETRHIVIANDNFCSIFGIPFNADLLTGSDCSRSAEETKHLFRQPDKFVTHINKILLNNKAVLNEEIEMINGKVYLRDYIPVIINDVLKGHLWKYTDVTESKSHERRLMQQEAKYRNIIANMRLGLLETDNEDTISFVNQQFCEMSGYSAEELYGRKSIDLLVSSDYTRTVREKNNLRYDGISDTYQGQVKVKNGDLRWWLTTGGPNFNDQGVLVGTVGISVDITNQKLLEEELKIAHKTAEESANAKEAFLANMSHEIRTPLNVVIGMIRELSRDSVSPRQDAYIKNAGLASQHLLSIVNDILDLTKIKSGQLNLDLEPFDLIKVIDETISILSPGAVEKMLKISSMKSNILAPVYIGDSNRIKQVLLNIVSNSIKFTEMGGISIDCAVIEKEEKSHLIQIRVADTGIGMDESFLDNIFEKFSQGDYASARKYGGTGLGMAISYELIQLMKGSIVVTSQLGVGTTVEFRLSLAIAPESEMRGESSNRTFNDLKGKNILLVEDNDLNRMVALNSLNFYGIKVVEAINGLEAIEKLRSSTYDLILMDLQMPEMGGIEATTIIRKELKLNTPVIALTAHALKSEVDKCLNAGMNDYIIKPFEETKLMDAILKNVSLPGSGSSGSQEDSSPEKLYNLEKLIEMSRGNKELVKKLIMIFIEQTPAAVVQIKEAWNIGDLVTVRKTAHRIKPNIDSFGIEVLKQEIRSIENLAEEGLSTSELETKINWLSQVIDQVVVELAKDKL